MKNVKVLLVASALFIGTFISTATEKEPVVKSKFSAEVAKLLDNPNLEMDVTTSVSFIINSEKEIVVLSVDTDNNAVERFIKSRLNYAKVESYLINGKEYTVPIRIVSEI